MKFFNYYLFLKHQVQDLCVDFCCWDQNFISIRFSLLFCMSDQSQSFTLLCFFYMTCFSFHRQWANWFWCAFVWLIFFYSISLRACFQIVCVFSYGYIVFSKLHFFFWGLVLMNLRLSSSSLHCLDLHAIILRNPCSLVFKWIRSNKIVPSYLRLFCYPFFFFVCVSTWVYSLISHFCLPLWCVWYIIYSVQSLRLIQSCEFIILFLQ